MRLAALLLVVALGCGGSTRGGDAPSEAGPKKPPPLSLAAGGETMQVVQRGRAEVPGSNGALAVQLGDITGGAVELVLARADGGAVLVTRTVRQGDVVPFTVDGFSYQLAIEHMRNVVVGDDLLEVRVRAVGGSEAVGADSEPVDERARIEAVIDAVARSGVVFIRNGSEHDAAAAAEHLRTKWSRAGDRVRTVEEFIEQLGSRSSQTGEPYRVRLPDGTERESGPWLRELSVER